MKRMSLEQAKELRTSEVWEAFCGEVDHRISLLFKQMATCKPELLASYQARVQQLEEVKNFPKDVIENEE